MWSTLAAAVALSNPGNLDLNQALFPQTNPLKDAYALQREANPEQPQHTQESIEDLIRRASPITGVVERQKLEDRYREIESRVLVKDDHTYLLDTRPRYANLNVSSYAVSNDGRYIALSQLERVDSEEIVSGSTPNYRLQISIFDRVTNKSTPLRLPNLTIQSDDQAPQAIERQLLNDIAFFSGAEARGRLLVLLIDRSEANTAARRVAWSAAPDGSCIKIGNIGWKEEITLNPTQPIGIDYAIDKSTGKTERTIFSPDGILNRETIDGAVYPFGWTANGSAIESANNPGQPRLWWSVEINNRTLKRTQHVERPADVTPTETQFSALAIKASGSSLNLNDKSTAQAVRLDHQFQTSVALPPIAKVPMQVFGLVSDGSAFLTNIYDLPTKIFNQRLQALREHDQIEALVQEVADAITKIVQDNKGSLPAANTLISSLNAQGISAQGIKVLYDSPTGLQAGTQLVEIRGTYWVGYLKFNAPSEMQRL